MNTDLLEFPFIVGVWGTVSDWAMVIVTGITALLLYKTLREQQRFTEIELDRFARENPPTFLLVKGSSARDFPISLTLRLTKSRLENLYIGINELPEGLMVEVLPTTERLNQKDELKITISYPLRRGEINFPNAWEGKLRIKYNDRMSNSYEQVLKLERTRNYISEPVLVS